MLISVIDRDPDSAAAVRDVLVEEGHEVITSPDRSTAERQLAGRDVDLVLVDMTLQDMDRAMGADLRARTPVLVVTSTSFEERAHAERALAPYCILEKPFSTDDLLEAIGTARGRTSHELRASRPPPKLLTRSAIRRVADFLDVSEEKASFFASLLEEQKAWADGPGPGTAVCPIHAGPRANAAEAFIVWIADGATYPRHGHAGGPEAKLVVRGGLRDDDGSELWAGEMRTHGRETEHASTAVGGAGCLLFAVIERA